MSEVEKQLQSAFRFILLRLLDNLKEAHRNICYLAPAMGKKCTDGQSAIRDEMSRVVIRNLPLNVLPITAV
jgi:hypothetical protein